MLCNPAFCQPLQGTPSAEVQAIAAASGHARGSTAYLNMETGDCHGDSAGLSALIGAGVSRVVVGIRHPLTHSRGLAIKELRQHGVQVDVLGEAACFEAAEWEDSTIHKCLAVNEVTMLLHIHAVMVEVFELCLLAACLPRRQLRDG